MQIANADVIVQVPPAREPEVSWPVWVGDVPELAAAFQPRTAAGTALRLARNEEGAADLVLSSSS
ncbi:hypothetical protein [Streptomyces collinus]|uniref:hypothetical protein n=1 Tax=Streptomyces collinus TaxID=42684 RepID=UPI00368CC222